MYLYVGHSLELAAGILGTVLKYMVVGPVNSPSSWLGYINQLHLQTFCLSLHVGWRLLRLMPVATSSGTKVSPKLYGLDHTLH